MDDREGSFVAVRRISQGLERGGVYNSSSGNFITLMLCIISPLWMFSAQILRDIASVCCIGLVIATSLRSVKTVKRCLPILSMSLLKTLKLHFNASLFVLL
ncbi:unnamed protein product [Cochlearia groenlandica]